VSVIQFSTIVTQVLEAANYTHSMAPHPVKTLHDIECPPGRGWVVSLMGPNYLGNPATQASAQLMVDAADIGQGTTLGMQAWHVGGPGNQISDGVEQAGYASFSRAMWLGMETIGATYLLPDNTTSAGWTEQNNRDMAAQLELVAKLMAELNRVDGTRLAWLNETEHRQAVTDYDNGVAISVSGWVRHEDWTNRQLSNTSHHDTGDHYPTDVLMAKAIAYANPVVTPPAPSTPTPAPAGDWLTMATPEEITAAIKAAAPTEVLFVRIGSAVYEHNVASGTRHAIATEAILIKRKYVLTKAGIKWDAWAGGKAVDAPDAFGKSI
jgi:hypothetical protein